MRAESQPKFYLVALFYGDYSKRNRPQEWYMTEVPTGSYNRKAAQAEADSRNAHMGLCGENSEYRVVSIPVVHSAG